MEIEDDKLEKIYYNNIQYRQIREWPFPESEIGYGLGMTAVCRSPERQVCYGCNSEIQGHYGSECKCSFG